MSLCLPSTTDVNLVAGLKLGNLELNFNSSPEYLICMFDHFL